MAELYSGEENRIYQRHEKRKKNDNNKKKQTALQKLKRRHEPGYLDHPTTSSTSLLENSFVLPLKLRSLKSDVSYENISHCDKRASDYEPKPVRGGKTTRNDAHLQLIRAVI